MSQLGYLNQIAVCVDRHQQAQVAQVDLQAPVEMLHIVYPGLLRFFYSRMSLSGRRTDGLAEPSI
jgi:hypothetical protein